MAVQLSVSVRNARADAVETAIGTSARLKIWSGSLPANCAAADAGTLLADITCPVDWMSAASAGAKALSGTWTDASADNNGTAVHFRLYESTAATCHMQGTVTASGGGGDMIVSTVTFVAGQPFSVTAYGWTELLS